MMAQATYRYRAVTPVGKSTTGQLRASSPQQALALVRGLGVSPVEVIAETAPSKAKPPRRANGKTRKAVNKTLSELAVLLKAGLPLDRAIALAIENIEHEPVKREFEAVLENVREGASLARAMAQRGNLFPSMALAMTEAGEANGRLGDALERLAETLEREEDLRQLVVSSMIYPAALMTIATGVILLMMLFVVPQFESVFETGGGELPASSMAVMATSRFLRTYGWHILIVLLFGGVAMRQLLQQAGVRASIDRGVLRVPQLGTLVTYTQTAIFARIMSVLVDGGVALPEALSLARRSMSNTHMADAVERVAGGLKEGAGLTRPLAAADIFPKLALGFLRTGEETSQLGLMLGRLADVLDRDVRLRLQRLIGLLTPAITVLLGAVVAGIIASIMSAILGFNDLAVAQ